MLEKRNKKELKKILSSYDAGEDTKSCLIYLQELEQMIKDSKKNNIDGIRIYFIRDEPGRVTAMGDVVKTVDGKGQMSIAIVPTHNYHKIYPNQGKGFCSADNLFVNDLCFVITPGGEHTGLCPNNCEGSGINP